MAPAVRLAVRSALDVQVGGGRSGLEEDPTPDAVLASLDPGAQAGLDQWAAGTDGLGAGQVGDGLREEGLGVLAGADGT
nr:hypothetical protein [Ornithinimicrobium murale]